MLFEDRVLFQKMKGSVKPYEKGLLIILKEQCTQL